MYIPFRHSAHHTHRLVRQGFTLIELLVSVAIITFITAVALVQHSQFNSTIALTNLAYEVALSVREAQTLGVSSRIVDGSSSNFGVHVNTVNPSQYVLYADVNNNNTYEGTELVLGFDITQGNRIARFCVQDGGGEECSDDINGPERLDILFERPNPDAEIYADGELFSSAIIYLSSRINETRCIEVQQTGQVSVISNPATCVIE